MECGAHLRVGWGRACGELKWVESGSGGLGSGRVGLVWVGVDLSWLGGA